MSIKTQPLTLTINHQQYGPLEVPEGLMMIDFLHEYVALTGCRLGCGQGICHACVAIVDHDSGTSEEVRTCITGAHYFNGKKCVPSKATRKPMTKGTSRCRRFSRLSWSITVFSAVTARRAL